MKFKIVSDAIVEQLETDKHLDVRLAELRPIEEGSSNVISVFLSSATAEELLVFRHLPSLWRLEYLIYGYVRDNPKKDINVVVDEIFSRVINAIKDLSHPMIKDWSLIDCRNDFSAELEDTAVVTVRLNVLYDPGYNNM